MSTHRPRRGPGPGTTARRAASPGPDKATVTNPGCTEEASLRRDDLAVTDLVTRAGNGNRKAWDALVVRYAPLVWSIGRRHQPGGADAEAAAQNLWLELAGPAGARSATRPRFPADWPPPPGGNAPASCARRQHRTVPGIHQTPRPFRTIQADDLYELISQRAGRSLILACNRGPAGWYRCSQPGRRRIAAQPADPHQPPGPGHQVRQASQDLGNYVSAGMRNSVIAYTERR